MTIGDIVARCERLIAIQEYPVGTTETFKINHRATMKASMAFALGLALNMKAEFVMVLFND